jgi:hypothetical protein
MLDLETSNRWRQIIDDDCANACKPLRVLSDAAGLSEQTIHAVVGDRKKRLTVRKLRRLLSAETVENIIDLATLADRWKLLPPDDTDFTEPTIICQLVLHEVLGELKSREIRVKRATVDAIRDGLERAVRKGGLRLPEPNPELEERFAQLETAFVSAIAVSRAKRARAGRR